MKTLADKLKEEKTNSTSDRSHWACIKITEEQKARARKRRTKPYRSAFRDE